MLSLGSLWKEVNNRRNYVTFCVIIFLLEIVSNIAIIMRVPYTEIDWIAYMQEVAGVFKEGQLDYSQLQGQTGPLVYPAGFVYIYSILYYITGEGSDIRTAQYIFMIIYLAFIAVVMYIYYKTSEVPPWGLFLLFLTKRIHSIFVLRLFNDCIAMLFLYIAIAYFIRNRWSWGCFWFSVAVSIKMNVLLFAPSLLLLLLKQFGIWGTIPKLAICAALQVVVGLPFLLHSPLNYIARSFNLKRQFFYVWTVNWKFLSEENFLHPLFSIILLVLTIFVLYLFAVKKWCRQEGGLIAAITSKQYEPTPEHIVTVMFQGNFIGILFSRTLHYQFYVWYFHTLPFLFFGTQFTAIAIVPLMIGIEVVWNIYPSNAYSSLALFILHLILLIAMYFSPVPKSRQRTKKQL